MKILIAILIMAGLIACVQPGEQTVKTEEEQNWTNYIRTAGHGLDMENIERTIKDAQETHLFGIEVDNDPPGRYESFLDPTEKLAALEVLAQRVHEINNYAFLYIAGLECITANADKTEHSFFKDHPDWVQRDIAGRPAMFGGGTAFWIREGDEDVWISPYAKEWRTQYMEHVRKIAATGIDGIFVDIPYWMTHFDGWEDTWASFDDYTVAAFKKKTGLDAKNDLKLGEFSDANFRKWVDFRMETLTEFMAEINRTAKSVNPECKVIAEIYPGIDESAVRVGADVYQLYNVVDLIAHEYSGGGGNAASKNPLDWFSRMAGMYSFRAFAQGKASLMLSYSWGERNKFEPAEPMKNLMLSNLMAGTNCWDAAGHVMSGSNDIDTRKEIYAWIAEHDKKFYKPRNPVQPVGIYFSPKTRDYFADTYIKSYMGMMYIMLQSHTEFQVVTPANLNSFSGDVLILPDVKCVSNTELAQFKSYLNKGIGLVFTAESGQYDETGAQNASRLIHDLVGLKSGENSGENYVYYEECPGRNYFDLCEQEFNRTAWTGEYAQAKFVSFANEFLTSVKKKFNYQPGIQVSASPFVSAQIAMVEGMPHVFLANFKGLKRDEVAVQIPEENVEIRFPSGENAKIYYLPYLGMQQELTVRSEGEQLICNIPMIEKGGVVWLGK